MPSADALTAPHSPGLLPPYLCSEHPLSLLEFLWLCRGKWPQPWCSLSQPSAVGFNSWKTRCSPLSLRFCGNFPSLHWLHVRSRERLSLCCVSVVVVIPAGGNIICS